MARRRGKAEKRIQTGALVGVVLAAVGFYVFARLSGTPGSGLVSVGGLRYGAGPSALGRDAAVSYTNVGGWMIPYLWEIKAGGGS